MRESRMNIGRISFVMQEGSFSGVDSCVVVYRISCPLSERSKHKQVRSGKKRCVIIIKLLVKLIMFVYLQEELSLRCLCGTPSREERNIICRYDVVRNQTLKSRITFVSFAIVTYYYLWE